MKTLTFSLIFAVIISSVLVGWLIDVTHQSFFAEPNVDVDRKISLLKVSGQSMADLLDANSDKARLLSKWNSQQDIKLQLLSSDDVALPQGLRSQLLNGQALLLEGRNGPSFSYYLPSSNQILQVHSPTLFEMDSDTGPLILTLSFYLGLALLLTLWAYPFARRLFLIKQASLAFGKGELDTRIEVGNVSGVKEVELAFNNMASRIQLLLDDVKLLSGGVSHELKTSLARLRFGIDLLQDDYESITDDHIQRLSEDTDEMIHLVSAMLQYTKLDMSLSAINKNELDVAELLNEIVGKLSTNQTISGKELRISFNDTAAKKSTILGDKTYIKILFSNLIANAVNYASKEVKVSLLTSKEQICVSIIDDGLGIDDKHLKDVFRPFFRAPDQSNKKTEKHYGLGLAVAKRICDMHGGQISLESAQADDHSEQSKNSTTAKVCLPTTVKN